MKTICDNCTNYSISPAQTTEVCFAQYEGSKQIRDISDHYIDLRMTGEKNHCKRFKKL